MTGPLLSLDSWQFLLLSTAAILACRMAGVSPVRGPILAVLNLYFIAHFVRDGVSAAFLATVLAIIYAAGQLRRFKRPGSAALGPALVVAGIWGTLFLVKDPLLLAPLNPFLHFPVQVVGLSYLMFRGISYVMEADLAEDASVLSFLNYMLFFPMVLAGPIERYLPFQKQLRSVWGEPDTILPALHRIANGFIKKFVLADNLAAFGVLSISQNPDASPGLLWVGALGQLFLVYLDFSGYCDIVIGIAMLMGFRLRENFDRPFLSPNVQAFWERWHMSLGQLLRDYVFNPLAKTAIQRSPRRFHFPLFVLIYCFTMLLVALWHGTTAGFFVFGVVHALALVAFQVRQKLRRRLQPTGILASRPFRVAGSVVAVAGTYAFVSVSLILWMGEGNAWSRIFAKMIGVAA